MSYEAVATPWPRQLRNVIGVQDGLRFGSYNAWQLGLVNIYLL